MKFKMFSETIHVAVLCVCTKKIKVIYINRKRVLIVFVVLYVASYAVKVVCTGVLI